MKLRNPFAIPEPIPESLGLDGLSSPGQPTWQQWEARVRAAYPIRFWLSRRLPTILARFKRHVWKTPLYWLRTHTYNRYHLIDMRNTRNGYKWGWIDRNRAVMFAAFAVLVDFVEKEYPGCVDWEYDEDHRKNRNEFMTLYTWWTKERKEEHDAIDKLLPDDIKGATPADYRAYGDADDALDAKDTAMLHRLIEVREILWT